jgi:hypothetical protein
MKKTWIAACVLLFVAAAGFAQTSGQPPLTREALAAILGQPAGTGSCPTPQGRILLAAKPSRAGLEKALCTATANCSPGTVSCSGNNSTTSCSSADRNCAINEQGHVTCDGVTTWCPTACTCTGTPIQVACCKCDQIGDCQDCCRCDGGSPVHCGIECSGGF